MTFSMERVLQLYGALFFKFLDIIVGKLELRAGDGKKSYDFQLCRY